MRLARLICCVAVIHTLSFALAAPGHVLCGTSKETDAEIRRQHQVNQLRIAELRAAGEFRGGVPNDRIIDGVVVLEDDGTLIVEVGPGNFDTDSIAIVDRALALIGSDYDVMALFSASNFRYCNDSREACVDDVDCPGEGDSCAAVEVNPEAGFAFYSGFNSEELGLNRAVFTDPERPGLRGFFNMNDLGDYPATPETPFNGFNGVATGVEILAHEFGHTFLSFINAESADMLGRGQAHWSFFLNSGSSVMEGNVWIDNADGTFTSAPDASQFNGYGQVDEYLMGLRGIDEIIEPIFVIVDATPFRSDSSFPDGDVQVSGTRVDITPQDLAAFNGPRDPASPAAQRDFHVPFVLVVPQGTEPLTEDMALIQQFRVSWESFFEIQTDGRGGMNTGINDPIPASAAFRGSPRVGAAPLTVAWRDFSHGDVTARLWDFGDGQTSAEAEPEHTYMENGNYAVRLTVDGPGGPVTQLESDFVIVDDFVQVFHDDFETERGWTVSGDATGGSWERAIPQETLLGGSCDQGGEDCLNDSECPTAGDSCSGFRIQPGLDETPGVGTQAFVTGAVAGEDVDEGGTMLVSPRIDTRLYDRLYLSYSRWLSTSRGAEPKRDVLVVEVSDDDGSSWLPLERIGESVGVYRRLTFDLQQLSESLAPTAALRLRFSIADLNADTELEAVVDEVELLGVELADGDGDGIPDLRDNCPAAVNGDQVDTDGDAVGDVCDADDDNDSVADAADNCPLVANAAQDDADADSFGDSCDCASADSTAWSVPGVVGPLRLAQIEGATEIAWTPPVLPGGTDVAYDLVRSTNAADFSGDVSCVTAASTETTASDSEEPQVVFYYLVRGMNACGPGQAAGPPIALCP